MDANELLKGINEFFYNILPKACSCSGWTEDGITNAFHWADFCEQVYRKYKNSHCRKKLDELIHSLSVGMSSSNQRICFNDLKKCTDMLYKAFCENPLVEDHLVEPVLLKLKNDQCSLETVAKRNNLNSLCLELLEVLKTVKLTNSDRSLYSEVQAIIYLETLKAAVLHITSEEEVEAYLSTCLEKLCEDTAKMEQLLQILLLNTSDESLSSVKDIQEFAINWTMYKILSNKYCPLSLFLWKHPSQLRTLSLNSSDFLNFYLKFLTECSSSLTLVSEDNEMEWISKSPDNRMLTFNEILSHFRTLLATDDDVCESTRKHLMNLLNTESESVIWKEIFSRVT